MFAVVHFEDTGEIEVVSTNWILDDKICAWPPYKSRQLKRALLEGEIPSEEWRIYDCGILNLYDSYGKALQKCMKIDALKRKAEAGSKSEEEKSRKKRKKATVPDSDDDDNSESSLSEQFGSTSFTFQGKNKSKNILHLQALNPEKEKKSRKIREKEVMSGSEEDEVEVENSSFTIENDQSEVGQKRNQSIPDNVLSQNVSSLNVEQITTEHLLKLILDIQKTLKEHTVLLNKLLNQEPCYSIEFFSQLPVTTMEELNELEKIIQDETIFKKIVQFLGGRGGYDVSSVVRNILKFLMTDDIACKFNWAGRGGKGEFRKLRLMCVVIHAARKNAAAKNAPAKQIEDGIKTWLNYTTLRMQQRVKSKAIKEVAEDTIEEIV